ncbi:MAG TPA: hypothetical protein VFD70_09170 [Anaerolineae bacterium]|nr:hypothetical protein [Anaerolineae bacterium]
MNSIRRERPGYGILWSELILDDAARAGTGRFLVRVEGKALLGSSNVATIGHTQELRVAIGIHPMEQEMVVLLGGNKNPREARRVFQLKGITDNSREHEFEITFVNWKITQACLNGSELEERMQ